VQGWGLAALKLRRSAPAAAASGARPSAIVCNCVPSHFCGSPIRLREALQLHALLAADFQVVLFALVICIVDWNSIAMVVSRVNRA